MLHTSLTQVLLLHFSFLDFASLSCRARNENINSIPTIAIFKTHILKRQHSCSDRSGTQLPVGNLFPSTGEGAPDLHLQLGWRQPSIPSSGPYSSRLLLTAGCGRILESLPKPEPHFLVLWGRPTHPPPTFTQMLLWE